MGGFEKTPLEATLQNHSKSSLPVPGPAGLGAFGASRVPPLSSTTPLENSDFASEVSQKLNSKPPSLGCWALWGHSGSSARVLGALESLGVLGALGSLGVAGSNTTPTRIHPLSKPPHSKPPHSKTPHAQNHPTRSHLTRIAAVLRVPPFFQLSSKPINSESNILRAWICSGSR